MRDSPDPNLHRQRQQQFVAHTQKLLEDERLILDTSSGRRPATAFYRDVTPSENTIAIKQKMIDLGLFDRELQRKMPPGLALDITLSTKSMFGGKQAAGRLRVTTLSPVESLLKGEVAPPLDREALTRSLGALPPSLGGLPQTVVVVSTSGFTDDARRLAERRPGGPVLLAEINDAGGWTITAPQGYDDVARLLDPETISQKKQRIAAEIDAGSELYTGGVSSTRLAERLHLPVPLVEEVLREQAQKTPGLATGTFEGTLVLYREGLSAPADEIGDNMPFWEKIKGIFGRGEESRDKKVSRLAQEKALLAQQRDKAYAEIELVEKKEQELTKQFPEATPLAQKRIATEISQLRKRVERIQQLVSTIDKKVNIIETGVHNLEMETHLSKEKLQSLESVATASEEVDVGMATLDQLNEQADAVSVVGTEMSLGASDVLAELQAKFAEKPVAETPAGERTTTGPAKTAAGAEKQASAPPPIPAERRKMPGAAEPG